MATTCPGPVRVARRRASYNGGTARPRDPRRSTRGDVQARRDLQHGWGLPGFSTALAVEIHPLGQASEGGDRNSGRPHPCAGHRPFRHPHERPHTSTALHRAPGRPNVSTRDAQQGAGFEPEEPGTTPRPYPTTERPPTHRPAQKGIGRDKPTQRATPQYRDTREPDLATAPDTHAPRAQPNPRASENGHPDPLEGTDTPRPARGTRRRHPARRYRPPATSPP